MCAFFLLLRPRLSVKSVMFDFNVSLSDDAPVFPILFAVEMKRNEKSSLWKDVFCVSPFFCLASQIKFSKCCI